MSEHLQTKLKGIALAAADLSKTIEERADKLIARQVALGTRAEEAFKPHEDLLAKAEQGVADLEGAIRQLSNAHPH